MTLSTQIKATANKSNRTYTIRVYSYNGLSQSKYRTIRLSKEEFQSCSHNTENDWRQFLKSDEYTTLK